MNFIEVRAALVESQEKALADLDKLACDGCNGIGECDDADIGDIMFNTFPCGKGNGTGYKRETT